MPEPNQPANDPGETSLYRSAPEGPGAKIGPYKLLQEIGEGGFGKVYMAEQQEPVRRKVALKIIKPGMDTKEVIARFESERQALALMDHPNIARVLDAGATDNGRPFFVMELVRGVPITEYCDKNSLTTGERLELFVTVCRAVQHAHQKGVIHRDLKPSNVMVTLHDGQPVPKVIDFGVAKATTQKLTERTMFTAYGQMIGTPAYMSPEQAEMSGLDIDTRSDIYSLGVVLYELLTGTTPFEVKRLRDASYIEMQRIIREEDPPKPSTRISTLGDSLTVIANHRRTDPAKLRQALAGDLDLIVMKALEKERGRRYETPNSFAQDIERFLRHEAIHARPQSAVYRLRKFAERNKATVATAAAVAICLLMGTVVSTVLAIQAMKQRDRAEASLIETEKQRKLAEEAQAAAELERDRAEKAKLAEAGERERAEEQRREAEEQRRVAEDERRRAEEQQKVAEKERQDAVAARMAESEQKTVAERERDRARALNDELNQQKEQQRRMLYVAQMNLIQKAWDADNVGRVRELLQMMRPGPGETDLRGFEWDYWMRRTHEELSAGKLETPPAYPGALSQDGTRLGAVATTTATETHVAVCDTATGKKVFLKAIPFARRPGNDQRTHDVIFVNSDRVAVVSRQWANLFIGTGGAANYEEYESRRKSAQQAVTLEVLSLKGTGEELFRLETTAPVNAPTPFAFTRDGSKMAGIVSSGQQQDIVQIWDGRTGSEIAQRGIPFAVETYDRRLAVSADGSRVALVASPRFGLNVSQFQFGMKILEMDSDKVVTPGGVLAPGGSSAHFQFSPDGRRLAMSSGGVVKVYDAATGDEVCRTAEARPSTTLALLEFSPDGRWLATAARMGEQPARTVKLWDAASGKAGPEFKGHTRPLAEIGFRDQGAELVSVERFGAIKSWRVPAEAGSKAAAVREALGNPQSMSAVMLRAFGVGLAQQSTESPASALKALTDLGILSGTRTGSGPQIRTIKARSADGRWIAGESVMSRTGVLNVAANSAEFSIAVEDTTGKLPVRVLKTSGGLTLALFSPDGSRLATGTAQPNGDLGEAAELKVWDVETGDLQFAATMAAVEEQRQFPPAKVRIFPAVADGTAFSANGRRLAMNYFETVNNQRALVVRVWDTSDGREIVKWSPTGLSGRVGGLRMSPDGETVLLGGTDSFDAYPQTMVMTTGKTSFNSTLSSVLQAWNATSGELLWRVTSPISLVRFTSDSRRVVGVVQAGWLFTTAANAPSAIVAWDTETGAEMRRIPLDRGRAYTRMVMSRDEKRLAVVGGATDSGSGDVTVYDIESGELDVSVQGHDGSIAGLAFSDNGSRLVTSAGLTRRYGDIDQRSSPSLVGETKIWDVATGQELLALAGGSDAPKFFADSLGGDPAAPFRVAPSPMWKAAPLDPRVEAEEWVEYLLASGRQKGLVPRGELARQIETDSSISEELRSAAVEQIRGLKRDATSLNSEAWAIAKQAGLPKADYERAIDYAREACEGKPDVVNYCNTLGVAQYRAGQFREALATLQQCMEMRKSAKPPNHGSDFVFLAMAHHQTGEGDKSREYFRQADRAMQAGRHWSEWKTHLSEAEELLGMRAAMTHFTEGNLLRDKREYDKALAEYEEALRLDPESPWIFANRGYVWHRKQDYARAMIELDRAIQLDPSVDWAIAQRGTVWRAQNQPERALADYGEAIRLNPDVMWYYNDRAAIHQAAARYEEAIKDYSATIRLEPRVASHYLDRGYMHRLAGRQDAAIKDCDEAIRIDPRNATAHNNRGLARERKGEFDAAVKDYDEAIRLNPKYTAALHNRGNTRRQKGEYDKAIADYDAALALDPKRVDSYNNRGNTWLLKNEPARAMADYDEAIRLNPPNVTALYNRARAALVAGDLEKVIADCGECLRLNPRYASAFNERGRAQLRKQEYDLAIADFSAAIGINPASAAYFSNRGLAWRRKETYDKALADFSESIRLDVKSNALNYRAWLLATCPEEKYRDGKQAVEDATKACELTAWKDGVRLDTLAAAHAQCGNFEEAVKWAEKAVELASAAQKSEREARLALYQEGKPYRAEAARDQ